MADNHPILYTKRLVLREVRLSDAEVFYKLRSNPDVMQYIQRPLAQSVGEVEVLLNSMLEDVEAGKSMVWVLSDADEQFVGMMGFWRMQPEHFRAEVGYIIAPWFHGRGYATEALAAVLQYGFENMGMHKIDADVHPDNPASLRVLARHGFVQEARFRDQRFFNGSFHDALWLGLLKSEWLSRSL